MFVDIECEQQLLGAILINNESLRLISNIISYDCFSESIHQEIFRVCEALIEKGKVASPVTLRGFLDYSRIISGGINLQQYIARLAASSTTIINAPDFASILRNLSDNRLLNEIGIQLQSPEGNPEDTASWAIDCLDGIVAARTVTGVPSLTIEQSVARAMDAAAAAYQRDGAIAGLATGLRDLDHKLLGLQRGELIVMAGRPGSGKTAAALCLSRNMAGAGHKGIFYSLEMGDVQLSQRMLTDEAYDHGKLAYTRLRSGRFDEKQFTMIRDAAMRLQLLPLRIEQQPSMTMGQISTRARQEKRRKGLDFFIIDYLGLMKSSGRYAGNRTNEIGELTSGVRGLAKELDCVALLLCQLNRGIEGREDKRPNMSDLRDSGNIEQDADVIIMIYREAYYLERKEPPAGSAEYLVWSDRMQQCYHKMQMIVEKQRMGPIGSIEVYCDIASNALRDSDYEIQRHSTEMYNPQMAF